jgi:hypothetical protein
MEDLLKSTLTLGGSGSGKSLGTLVKLLQIAAMRLCAICVMDKHGLLTKVLALHLASQGLTRRLLYDEFSNFNRVLAVRWLEQSTHQNAGKKQSENHARITGFMELLWRASQRQGEEGSIFEKPMGSMFTELGIKLWLFQVPVKPMSWFPYAFRLKHPRCRQMVDQCTDEEVREEWRTLLNLAARNADTLLESKIGFSRRLSRQVFGLPAFRERCDGDLAIYQLLQEKRIILLDGSNDGSVPDEVSTAIFGSWNLGIIQAQQKHFSATGQPLLCVVVWEEAPASRIVGPVEIDISREGRKYGFIQYVLGQEKDSWDLNTWSAMKTNTQVHEWYNPGEPDLAMEAAKDIAYAQLDPYAVHHIDEIERTVTDGFTTEIRKGRTKSKEHSSESETEINVPIIRKVIDRKVSYQDLDHQVKKHLPTLLNLNPGEFMLRIRGKYVSTKPEYRPLLPDPYPEELFPGLAEKKLRKVIEQSQTKPEFKTPQFTDQCETTTPSDESVTKKPSRNLPKARGRRGNSSH